LKKTLLWLLLPLSLFAELKIAVSYPYIGALTKAVAGENVDVIVLAKGNWDPHFVVARPSLISKLRNADGLIMNGAQLEIGWLPPLIGRAANVKVQPQSKSFLNLSGQIQMIQVPKSVDRSMGDVHPDGNPHFHLDPNNIVPLAQVIAGYLIALDYEHKEDYEKNLQTFADAWEKNLKVWDKRMAPKRGMKVIQFHDNLGYFNKAYGLVNIGTIEPLPGISPSSRHTLKLLDTINEQKPCCIFHDVYHSTKTAQYLVSKTGIELVLMPHDIGALDSIESLKGLFDHLTQTVTHD